MEMLQAVRAPPLSSRVELWCWEQRTISTLWRCRLHSAARLKWRSSVRTTRSCWWWHPCQSSLVATRHMDIKSKLQNLDYMKCRTILSISPLYTSNLPDLCLTVYLELKTFVIKCVKHWKLQSNMRQFIELRIFRGMFKIAQDTLSTIQWTL